MNTWAAPIRMLLCACLLAPLAACADAEQQVEASQEGQMPQPIVGVGALPEDPLPEHRSQIDEEGIE